MDAATRPISPTRKVNSTTRRGERHQRHTSPGFEAPLRMLREVQLNRYLTLSNVGIDLLHSVFPVNGSRTREQVRCNSTQYLPSANVRSPAYVHRSAGINGGPCHVIETCGNNEVLVHFWRTGLDTGDKTGSNPHSDGAVTLGKNSMCERRSTEGRRNNARERCSETSAI